MEFSHYCVFGSDGHVIRTIRFAASVTFDGNDFVSATWVVDGDGSASANIGDFVFEATSFQGFSDTRPSNPIYSGVPFEYGSENTISVRRADSHSFAVTAIEFGWGTFGTEGGGFSYYDENGDYQSCSYCFQHDAMDLIAGGGLNNISSMQVFAYNGAAEVWLGSITVGNVVPIPAAVWLFASALVGLGWWRRRPSL